MIDCIDNERTWKPQVYMPFTNRDKTMYRLITDEAQERTKICRYTLYMVLSAELIPNRDVIFSKFLIFDQDLSFKNVFVSLYIV